MSVAFLGPCPYEVLSDAALTFEIQFIWPNWQPDGTSSRLVFPTPLLRAGYWNYWVKQTDPVLWTAYIFGGSWIVGNYKINGTGLANDLVKLDDPFDPVSTTARAGFEIGPFVTPVGSFILGPGNILIEEVPPCACSAREAGADIIEWIVENDLEGEDWVGRNVPQYSTVKIRGERQ